MADKSTPVIFTSTSLDYYPSSQKITPQKIIGIISIVAITVFFSIASFYNAQLSLAIINTCFFTLLGGAIIHSLIFPTDDMLLSDTDTPAKPYDPTSFVLPIRRRSTMTGQNDLDGVILPKPGKLGPDGTVIRTKPGAVRRPSHLREEYHPTEEEKEPKHVKFSLRRKTHL